ncbi:ATP-binding protein [Oscillospiraceae bacterium MB08-C2-2]|nr:ATP-binding protein [Oscillospiraceae bacterium MB08-C2-2]
MSHRQVEDALRTELSHLKNLYSDSVREAENLRRRIIRLERDKTYSALVTENMERLRDFNAEEKELQFFYNQLLLANCPDMIFVFDQSLRFVLGTEACHQYLGFSSLYDLTGQTIQTIFGRRFSPQWVQKTLQLCCECYEKKVSKIYKERLSQEDEQVLHLDVTVSPAIDVEGRCMGIVLVMHDMTQLTLLKEEAEKSALTKGRFLATMSHELRTPLNAIKGMSDLLKASSLSAVQREYIQNISASSFSLIRIVNDLLDFSKIEAQRMELSEQSYDFSSLISGISNLMGINAENKRLFYTVDIAPDIPLTLIGDDLRLRQVLLNLLSNAIKYTEQGWVRLSVSVQKKEADCITLYFVVEDTGIGIREEEKDKMFEVFSQLDTIRNRLQEGTGLGLAISKHIVELLGGSLEVCSAYEKGSCFSFAIPQKFHSPAPVAPLGTPEDYHVLLLADTTFKQEAYLTILNRLKVQAESCSSPQFLQSLSDRNYTHVLYLLEPWEEVLTGHGDWFPGARRIPIINMLRDSDYQTDASNDLLFEPLLVTQVAHCLAKTQQTAEQPSPPHSLADFSVRAGHVLAVDDNEINLIVCQEILKQYGLQVDIAYSGQEALKMAASKSYDMIFIDHMMPELDGLETARWLRITPGPNQNTPLIALSANAIKGMREVYLENGMNDFVPKPIEIADISRVLLEFLPHDKILPHSQLAQQPS